jgi:hypothetical protein
MYTKDLIDMRFFYQYCLTTSAFIIGIFVFPPIKIKTFDLQETKYESRLTQLFYLFTALIYLVNKIYLIVKVGFPIFSEESRMLFYNSVGINKRISDSLVVFCLFFVTERLISRKYKWFDILLGIFILFNFLLSGSKSEFSTLFIFIGLYSIFDVYVLRLINRYQLLAAIAIGSLFCLVNFMLSGSNFTEMWNAIGFSLIDRGDAYVCFYGADYNSIMYYFSSFHSIGNFFVQIFRDVLTVTRIIPYDQIGPSFSEMLMKYIYGYAIEGIGTNNVYNLQSLVTLGWWGSVAYSFFIGALYSFIRNKLIYNLTRTRLTRLIYIVFASNATALMITINYAIFNMFMFVAMFFLIYILSDVFMKFTVRREC